MTTSTLTLAADLVESVAAQDRTAAEALAILDAHGLTVDREQLSEAVALVHLHRLYEDGQGNPYDLLGTDGPRCDRADAWPAALAEVDRRFIECLTGMGVPS